jgi:hypothetical protein
MIDGTTKPNIDFMWELVNNIHKEEQECLKRNAKIAQTMESVVGKNMKHIPVPNTE